MRTLLYREAISAGQGLAMAVWRAGELASWRAGELARTDRTGRLDTAACWSTEELAVATILPLPGVWRGRGAFTPLFGKSGSCPNLEPPGLRRGQPAACARKGRSRALAGAARIWGLGWRPGGVKRGGQAALAAATSQ